MQKMGISAGGSCSSLISVLYRTLKSLKVCRPASNFSSVPGYLSGSIAPLDSLNSQGQDGEDSRSQDGGGNKCMD
jgi:hypothetical protein